MKRTTLALAIAAGTCLTVGQAALAQQLINISGASLLENYVKATASTNDFIDVNKDLIPGTAGPGPQNLCNIGVWNVNYRVTGSVNGFRELLNWGAPNCSTTGDTGDILGAIPGSTATNAYYHFSAAATPTQYMTAGAASGGVYNAANPGGAPRRAVSLADRTVTNVGGCITIDVSPLDVSTVWATQKPGTANPFRKPFDGGYGTNPRLSTGRNGQTAPNANPGLAGGLSSQLINLATLATPRDLYDGVPANAVANRTIFDTQLFYAPITPMVNFGTGLKQVTMSELRHIFLSGRTAKGENLVAIVRDAGSGTRNAWSNCLGIDPSWGVGDSIGGESNAGANDNLGANYAPSNKASGSRMIDAVRNQRLGIGYAGPETGFGTSGWLVLGRLEIPSVQNDLYGGTLYVRPTVTNVVDNGPNGWVIGGQAVLATIGDPRAEPVADGGNGLSTPKINNKAAADYVNNIRRSIASVAAAPGSAPNDFTPGELAATQFILLDALQNLHSLSDPLTLVSQTQNSVLRNYIVANNVIAGITNTFGQGVAPAVAGNSPAGKAPTRTTAANTYSDQTVNSAGDKYVTQGGANVGYGSNLPLRNLIAGDFNADGLRNVNDIAELVKAFRSRNGGAAWVSPAASGALAAAATGAFTVNANDAIIEVLGDFNGDGSITAADVRYFADGLALDPGTGNLDRRAGFTAVDNASQAAGGSLNFFSTTFPAGNPKVYAAGDSRVDIAGNNTARGWAPIGNDGVIDCKDLDYINRQFKQAGISGGAANWSDLNEAPLFDLSADMNNDLVVDQADITEALNVLGTAFGDVNLDGKINQIDVQIVNAAIATPPAQATWCNGDINGDGVVNAADRIAVCPADYNRINGVDLLDIFAFLGDWFASNPKADYNGASGVDLLDIFAFLGEWFNGPCV